MEERELISKIIEKIEEDFAEDFIDDLLNITSIPALSPLVGGDGEWEKAEFIKEKLKEVGIDEIIEYNAPDLDVSKGYRPNFIGKLKGKSSKKSIWILTHLDVEPAGDLSLWEGDPFDPYIEEGRIYGRGAEDNNQDIISSIYAIKTLKELSLTPPYDINLLFLSDEESGSKKGIRYILSQHPEIFISDDYYIVADGGCSSGLKIEIAEKGVLWFKFHIKGKATHASTPHLGKNTLKVTAKLIQKLDNLHSIFNIRDDIFEPPYSTFEPTLKEKNVPNVNMIPGNDTFYMDCRILPEYSIKEVEQEVKRIADEVAKEEGVRIFVSKTLEIRSARKTNSSSRIIKNVRDSIREILGKDPVLTGIGHATLASFLRERGFKVAVWRKVENTGHKPNENCVIENAMIDAEIFTLTTLKD